ncbi:MAG: YjgP/YjgQ family permease [Candidatus Caenarcaniphilales bacterium]|nr:YjgP/YjgQ family permease [Candidatus Caenarcaniphilales bacterium]
MALKILDKHIFSEFWLPFVGGASIITGVWLGIDKLKVIFKLLAISGASVSKGIVILGLEVPHMLALTLPISVLFACFLAFQKLSTESEIIALRATGISFKRIMLPVVYLGILTASLAFSINEFVVPQTSPLAKLVYSLAIYQNPVPENSEKSYNYIEKNAYGAIKRIFHVAKIKDKVLYDLLIIEFGKKKLFQVYTAKEASWNAKRGGWQLFDGKSSSIKKALKPGAKSKHFVSDFQSTFIPSSIDPQKILDNVSQLKELSFYDLKKYIDENKSEFESKKELNSALTSFHNKFAYPLSCIFLAIIGACLGITQRRSIINWGYIGMGAVVFLFYISQTIFDSMGESGAIAPALAMWIPNLIFAGISYWTFMFRAEN